MSINERDWDLEAAEYVLGTQSEENTRVFDALYRVDVDWQRRVHCWQVRLDPLHALTPAAQPPDGVLEKVLELIPEQVMDVAPVSHSKILPGRTEISTDDTQVMSLAAEPPRRKVMSDADMHSAPSIAQSLEQWRERARYWKLTALVALVAIAALLVIGPNYLARQWQADNQVRTVAVLQSDADAPLWVVAYLPESAESSASGEMARGSVAITRVGEPKVPGELSHQLWMVLAKGADVRSVGLVPEKLGETITLELPMALGDADEFAVSLEPLGGVQGPEHGPLVARTSIIRGSSLGS